jgi:hypothetical protein
MSIIGEQVTFIVGIVKTLPPQGKDWMRLEILTDVPGSFAYFGLAFRSMLMLHSVA